MAEWLDGAGGGAACDVVALLDSEAGAALAELVATGALVSLGTTRDGGALGITVTVDGRWRRDYFRDAEQLGDWLAEALPAVREAMEAARASSERGGRPRRARGL